MFDEAEDTSTYMVVVNHEEQYSIWPVERPLPSGWTELSVRGSRQDCLAHIKEVWTDMRPLSLRRAMEADTTPRKADATLRKADAAPRKIESKKTEPKKTQLRKAAPQGRKKAPRAAARADGAKRPARRPAGRAVALKKTKRR